ncbi:MAG: signal peptidase I [Microbacterium sp.]|uniref:signal peptidase I n=1 Tax=Microbacterium sp. TaxID=51671 RepID=UPI003A8A4E5D
MTSETTATTEPRARHRGGWNFLRDLVVIVVIALAASFLIKTFLVRSFYIPSGSMAHTLEVQDRILVDEITPRFSGYGRGDVVVFRDPGGWLPPRPADTRPPIVQGVDWALSLVGLSAPDSNDHLIKRIIGLPGDRVVCCNALGQITVNGTPIDETEYIVVPPGRTAASGDPFDVTVPEGSLWVLGDNRYSSKDSRYNQDQPGDGFVPLDNVVGRAFVITWPLGRFGLLDDHGDVFAAVPDAGS